MTLVELIGYGAGALTTVAFIPQVIKAWRTRQTRDISLGMFLAFCAGLVLWLAYGWLTEAWPIVIANTVTLALAGTILVLKLRHG